MGLPPPPPPEEPLPPPPPPEEPPPPPPVPRIRVVRQGATPSRTTRPPTEVRTRQIKSPRRIPRKRRRGRGFLVIKVLLVLFLLLVLALILVPQLRDSPLQWFNPMSYRQFPETADFQVERRVSMTGVYSFQLDVPRPRDLADAQQVRSVSSNPDPQLEQRYGYDWMVWDGSDGSTIVSRYSMHTRTLWWDIDSDDSLTMAEAVQYDPVFNTLSAIYNHDEWQIEASHPNIISVARQLEVDGGTVYDNVVSVYKYLDVNFEYGTREGGMVKASSETLQDRVGDCDDTSFLYVAILRAMGVPAWPELGAMYDSITNAWVGHGWLEVYIPTTTGGVNATIDMVNDEFLIRGANRFSDFKSDGDGNHLQDYYYSYAYVPKPGSPQISDEFTNLAYDTSGTVTVKLGSDGKPVPGFECLLIIPAIAIALLICRRRVRQREKRPS